MKPFSFLIGSTTFVVTVLFPLSAFANPSPDFGFDDPEWVRFYNFYENQDPSQNEVYEFESYEVLDEFLSKVVFNEFAVEGVEQSGEEIEQLALEEEQPVTGVEQSRIGVDQPLIETEQPEDSYLTTFVPVSQYRAQSSSSSSSSNRLLDQFLQGAKDSTKRLKNGEPFIRYKLGGKKNPDGKTPGELDCATFTKYIYNKYLNYSLPNTTWEQFKKGKEVSVNNLKVGDLVFYENLGHVGVYLGNNKVLHNSTSKGKPVIVDMKYYRPQRAVRIHSVSKKLNAKKTSSQSQGTSKNNNSQTKNSNKTTKNNNPTSNKQTQTNKNQTNNKGTKQNQNKESDAKNNKGEPESIVLTPYDQAQ